jgi:hypothetical protein
MAGKLLAQYFSAWGATVRREPAASAMQGIFSSNIMNSEALFSACRSTSASSDLGRALGWVIGDHFVQLLLVGRRLIFEIGP